MYFFCSFFKFVRPDFKNCPWGSRGDFCPTTLRRCAMTVDEMKNVDIRTVDREELVDIRDVSID